MVVDTLLSDNEERAHRIHSPSVSIKNVAHLPDNSATFEKSRIEESNNAEDVTNALPAVDAQRPAAQFSAKKQCTLSCDEIEVDRSTIPGTRVSSIIL